MSTGGIALIATGLGWINDQLSVAIFKQLDFTAKLLLLILLAGLLRLARD